MFHNELTEWRGTFEASRLKLAVAGDAAALLRLTRHPYQHATISMKVRCRVRGMGESGATGAVEARPSAGQTALGRLPIGRLIRCAFVCA